MRSGIWFCILFTKMSLKKINIRTYDISGLSNSACQGPLRAQVQAQMDQHSTVSFLGFNTSNVLHSSTTKPWASFVSDLQQTDHSISTTIFPNPSALGNFDQCILDLFEPITNNHQDPSISNIRPTWGDRCLMLHP